MKAILNGKSKFAKMPLENDNMHPKENFFSNILRRLKRKNKIDSTMYERKRSTEIIIPVMCKSTYHAVAKWLASLLELLRQKMARYGLKDIYHLIDSAKEANMKGWRMFPLDFIILFTNVSITETIMCSCDYWRTVSKQQVFR